MLEEKVGKGQQQRYLIQLIFIQSNCKQYVIEQVSFYSARNARIASAVLATAIPSVRLSVCPSVTRRYCVKTTARSTMQLAPLDSKMCLVLYKPKIFPRDDLLPLKFWLKVTYPLLKAASFDTFCLVAPQP